MRLEATIALAIVVATVWGVVPSHAAGDPLAPVETDSIEPCTIASLPLRMQNDSGSARDAKPERPVPLEEGSSGGCLGEVDPSDWFVFEAAAGDLVRIAMQPPSSPCFDFDVYLHDPSGVQVDASIGPCGVLDVITFTVARTGVHTLEVSRYSGVGDYGLRLESGPHLSRTCPAADDAASGRDADEAHPIAIGFGLVEGCIDEYDASDWYSLTVPADSGFTLNVTSPTCSPVSARLYGPERHEIAAPATSSCSQGRTQVWTYEETTFLIQMKSPQRALDPPGPYRLAISKGLATPPPCTPANDAGAGRDSTRAAPAPLAGPSLDACLDTYDRQDWFTLSVAKGEDLVLRMTPDGCLEAQLLLLDSTGNLLASSSTPGCGTKEVRWLAEDDIVVSLVVDRTSGAGHYQIDTHHGGGDS